jgi:signal transduction histidine kinase
MKHRAWVSQTASLLDSTDWSRTPLGPRSGWPVSLRSHVSMVMVLPTPAIIFWGPDLNQIYNDGYAQIMGPRHPRHFGSPYRECWPDTYPLIYPWMRRVLDDGEVIEVERELIPLTRLGFDEDAYFTFTFSPLRDDDGRIAGILQPVFEVTEAVLAGRRADLLRRLSGLSARTPPWDEAMAVLAEDRSDITAALVHEVDATGASVVIAATPGASPESMGRPQPVRPVAAAGEAVPGGSPRTVALPLPTKARSGRSTTLQVQTNGRLPYDAAYAQFIEMVAVELVSALERHEATVAEERQRAYLDRLFMQAPAGIAVLRGPRHVFELVNPMYSALIGRRQVLGLPLVEAMPELVGQPFVDTLDEVYRSGRPYVGLAEPAMLEREPDSAPQASHFNYVYQPLHDGEQRPQGILVFCYEVTAQVLAQRQSEQLAEALRQEDRRKDEFLAMLAHELRNPLAPIRSAGDLLRRDPGNAPVVERASRIITRQVGHLAALIDDLLDVSRVTRGLEVLARTPQELKPLLLDAVEQVRPVAEARGHRVRMDLPARQLWVDGDRKRLVQIFANILSNASKYTPDHGQITLTVHDTPTTASVAIEDTGIGIDAALLPRVFDMFVQGDRGSARSAGGLGIGLALARTLVQMHGGSISAHSPGPGQGSRVEVTLPLREAEPAAEGQPGDADPVPGHQDLPVLVVDDNRDAGQMLALQLRSIGYRVDVVEDGQSALTATRMVRYRACLLDMGLPDMHGTELARHLAAADATRPVLIGVSGYGQASDAEAGRRAGLDAYFVKPVDLPALSRTLADLTRGA